MSETVPSLVELYSSPELRQAASSYIDMYHGIDDKLEESAELAHITDRAVLADQLDTLAPSRRRSSVATLLGCLPVSTLLYEHGPAIFAWTITADDSCRVASRSDAIEAEGFDIRLLTQAREIVRQQRREYIIGREVLAHNAVMEATLGTPLQNIDLPMLLQQSRNAEITKPLSNKRVADYALIPLTSDIGKPGAIRPLAIRSKVHSWHGKEQVETDRLSYPMHLNTPTGFALTYKGIPQAIAGLVADGSNGILIRQLQGVRGRVSHPDAQQTTLRSSRGLTPIDWRKLLVGASTQLAEMTGLESVAIVDGNTLPDRYNHFSLEEARQAYNQQAERLGFTQSADGNWRKPVAAM